MLNEISDDTLRSLYWGQGLSGKQIAKRLGCSPAAVSMRMKASGIKTRSPHDYPPSEKQIAAWRENGKKLGQSESNKKRAAVLGRKNKGRRKRSDYEFGGHEKVRDDGYIKVYVPDHPCATKDGFVMKHRLVMERHLGRYLTPDEDVHHINHVRNDNRLENLMLLTKKEHAALHMRERHERRRQETCSIG